MLQETNLHFNEIDLLNLISKFEVLMEKIPDSTAWKKELEETRDFWNKIWWSMKEDTEYYLFSEPF